MTVRDDRVSYLDKETPRPILPSKQRPALATTCTHYTIADAIDPFVGGRCPWPRRFSTGRGAPSV